MSAPSPRGVAAAGLAAALALAAAPALAAPPAGAADRFPRAASAYVVAIGDREVWARDPDAPRRPASLTKLMTALVLLEDARWSPAAEVTVSARAARETGSRAGLAAGDRARAGELLAATLVGSSNDACHALAEHAAGTERAFVARMNARAAALGLAATRFQNACGHDAKDHHASARDLLRLARAALAHPELRRLAALGEATVTTGAGRVLRVRTTNPLLGRLRGATGLKSGYTPGAGRCAVAVAERDGVEVVVVLLDASDRWWAAAGLVEAAFREARTGG